VNASKREAATYEEIARAIGLSPARAEQICKQALRKLRNRSAASELARLAASRDYSELNLEMKEREGS
jgi:DNA-directed RNA polymerase sigma subunit (sigma70/sigma32)